MFKDSLQTRNLNKVIKLFTFLICFDIYVDDVVYRPDYLSVECNHWEDWKEYVEDGVDPKHVDIDVPVIVSDQDKEKVSS